MSEPMPVVFVGHGNPMISRSRNIYTDSWRALGNSLPRVAAVLVVSAHWYIAGCAVTATLQPRTIHDFGGFPRELYAVQYPAPGSLELANRVKSLLAPVNVAFDESWGIDHGAWSVLTHLFPRADIPIVQLAIDRRQPPAFHYELGRRLAVLREEDVLILGSGNLVHNLQSYVWDTENHPPYDWAVRFERQALDLLQQGEDARLIAYEELGNDARLSIPTPEHFLPLLYALGARRHGEPVRFPVRGIDGGSMSMMALRWG